MKKVKLVIVLAMINFYIKTFELSLPQIVGAAKPKSLFPDVLYNQNVSEDLNKRRLLLPKKDSSAVENVQNIEPSKNVALDETLAQELINKESLMRDYFHSIKERELGNLMLSRPVKEIEHYLAKLEKKEERLMQEQERLRQEQKRLIQAQIKIEIRERAFINDLILKEMNDFSSSNVNQDRLIQRKALEALKNRLFLQIEKDLQTRQVSLKMAKKLLNYFLFEFENTIIDKFDPKIRVKKVSFV